MGVLCPGHRAGEGLSDMPLHLLRRLVKAVPDPLIHDAEITADEEGLQIGLFPAHHFPLGRQPGKGIQQHAGQVMAVDQGKHLSVFVHIAGHGIALIPLHLVLMLLPVDLPLIGDFEDQHLLLAVPAAKIAVKGGPSNVRRLADGVDADLRKILFLHQLEQCVRQTQLQKIPLFLLHTGTNSFLLFPIGLASADSVDIQRRADII